MEHQKEGDLVSDLRNFVAEECAKNPAFRTEYEACEGEYKAIRNALRADIKARVMKARKVATRQVASAAYKVSDPRMASSKLSAHSVQVVRPSVTKVHRSSNAARPKHK